MPNNCILWKGAISAGYGHVWNGDKVVTVHRLAYQKANGLIPKGIQIHHLCHNRLCINPEHLVALTISDHQKLHYKIDKRIGFDNSLKTHCKNGHVFDKKIKTGRSCSICYNLRSKNWSAKHLDYYREYKRQWRTKRKLEGLPCL